MKTLFLVVLLSLGFPHQSLASGCFNASFYNLDSVAKTAGAKSCYYEKLEKISNPASMADRQYNYFVEKMNEYATVLGASALDSAAFEFMFYPAVRGSSLAAADARKVDFDYTQTFSCYQADGTATKATYQVYVFGVVGLTGVCLYKTKTTW